jgi:hypothetical protein
VAEIPVTAVECVLAVKQGYDFELEAGRILVALKMKRWSDVVPRSVEEKAMAEDWSYAYQVTVDLLYPIDKNSTPLTLETYCTAQRSQNWVTAQWSHFGRRRHRHGPSKMYVGRRTDYCSSSPPAVPKGPREVQHICYLVGHIDLMRLLFSLDDTEFEAILDSSAHTGRDSTL